MQPPLPCPTPTWRNDTYEAISPSKAELSAKNKTVIITGGGSGIGQETAIAFAQAGASKLVLLGRNEANLKWTASMLPEKTETIVKVVDITDATAINGVAVDIGTWDVLILGAGYMSNPGSIAKSASEEWWQSYETNVKGTYLTVKAFAPNARSQHAAMINVTTGTTPLPATMLPGLSAYISSKLAATKLFEFAAAEYPNIFVANVHPGMVETSIFKKSGAKTEALPMDQIRLPAHFILWLASPEGAFLNGRTVWANWDVGELKAQAQAIRAGSIMTSGMHGWPYSPPS